MIKNNYEFLAFTTTQVASQLWMECSASGMIEASVIAKFGKTIEEEQK